ncbi:hypothetical protein TNCV_2727911 [Trichonephila clavipes]|nr:hypothetical protein TNCV_2727911 [Trichonephila clavipes]
MLASHRIHSTSYHPQSNGMILQASQKFDIDLEDTDSNGENEMNDAALDPKSFEMRSMMEKKFSYLDVHSNGEFVMYLPLEVHPSKHQRELEVDEAHFWLNGYVNKQNCRIWSEANPQVYVETPLHPEKLTVWCALWAGGILQKR